ncbi:MAG: type pilus assembly protein PilB, partial [Solirubrobacteraceae bacterium]|nr:type pilus assembly protein PilB [Solirubrobacteraceae bacterium]
MLSAAPSQHAQSLAPAAGVTPPPADAEPQRFLSDVIIARRLVEPAAMRAALQASLAGRSLTEILVANGSLSEDDLARTLAEHHRLDHVDLERFAVDADATALIEPDVARRLGAVPIAFLPEGAVVVALYDPNGSTAVLELARLTNRRIQPAVASRSQIEALIDAL